jgi:Tol biopolymer transport system component
LRTSWLALAAIVGLALGWTAATWFRPPAKQDTRVQRFAVPCPEKSRMSLVAISPDGRHLVYSSERGGAAGLFSRPLDAFEATPLTGTEGGRDPFFSPDGQWLAFFTGKELKKIPFAGGTPRVLCSAGGATSGSWGTDDTIVFSSARGEATAEPVLARVSAAGGEVEVLTTLDPERGERSHVGPHILPDGQTVLFVVQLPGAFRIAVLSLETGERRDLLEGASPWYTPTGHLVFYEVDTARLSAVAFDPASSRVTGSPLPLVEGVGINSAGLGTYALSDEGTLVFSSIGGARDTVINWIDREGRVTPAIDRPGTWHRPRFSPDGTRLLLLETGAPHCCLWTFDLRRRTLSRLTFQGDSHDAIWNHDGRRVTFGSQVETTHVLHWMPADGSTAPEQLISVEDRTPNPQFPSSWSRDGQRLLFAERRRQTGYDVFVLEAGDPPRVRPFLESEFDERLAAWSPDGHWIAYQSDESGRSEIYVRAYPGPGGKTQISTDGGTGPIWSAEGDELFYVEGGRHMMRVAVTTEPAFRASSPQLLFVGDLDTRRTGNYDLAPDGTRFAVAQWATADRPTEEVRIVLNWYEELKRAVTSPRRGRARASGRRGNPGSVPR